MEATATTLAKLIKTMRKAEGVTQPELAEMVYSDVSSICRWEHGESITYQLCQFVRFSGLHLCLWHVRLLFCCE